MAFWRATDVDLPQNSAIVTVNTGDDVGSITSGYIIQINAGQFLEVKTVNTGASPQTIELYQIYTGTAINGGTAIAAPTQGAIKEATEELRNLRITYESLADSVSSTATANSVVKRNGSAQVLVADATANNHAVALGQLGTVYNKNITTSAFDTTAGRITKVGDGGLLSTTGTPIITDLDDFSTPQGLFGIGSSSTGTRPTGGTSFAHLIIYRQATTGISQVYINGGDNRMFFRSSISSVWQEWVEVYHSGNTNFDVFGGVAPRIIGTGYAHSSTSATVYLPLNSRKVATSISIPSGSTFDVRSVAGAILDDTLTEANIAFNSVSSERLLRLIVTGTGFTVGPIELRARDGSSKITVNF